MQVSLLQRLQREYAAVHFLSEYIPACAGLAAAEADKGEGLRMLIARAGGRWARTVAELDSSGTSQVHRKLSTDLPAMIHTCRHSPLSVMWA